MLVWARREVWASVWSGGISLPVNYTPVCNLEYPQVLKSKNPLSPPLHVLSKRRNTRDHISYQTCLRSTSESKNLFFYNTFFIQFYPQQTTTNRQTRTKKSIKCQKEPIIRHHSTQQPQQVVYINTIHIQSKNWI